MALLASGADLFSSLGSILAGLSELLVAIGAGIGFVIRSRRNARRERARAETAATVAATETKRVLEARLEQQHTAQIEQFKQQIKDLTKDRQELLNRLLDMKDKDD